MTHDEFDLSYDYDSQCGACGVVVDKYDRRTHTVKHIKDSAGFLSEFNSSLITFPIIYKAIEKELK